MKWQKERDDLIAQTKAFVQSVAGRTPKAVLGSVFNKPAPIEDPFEDPFTVLAPVSPPPLPIDQVTASIPTSTEAKPPEVKPAVPEIWLPKPTGRYHANRAGTAGGRSTGSERYPQGNPDPGCCFSGTSAPLPPRARCLLQFRSDKSPLDPQGRP